MVRVSTYLFIYSATGPEILEKVSQIRQRTPKSPLVWTRVFRTRGRLSRGGEAGWTRAAGFYASCSPLSTPSLPGVESAQPGADAFLPGAFHGCQRVMGPG